MFHSAIVERDLPPCPITTSIIASPTVKVSLNPPYTQNFHSYFYAHYWKGYGYVRTSAIGRRKGVGMHQHKLMWHEKARIFLLGWQWSIDDLYRRKNNLVWTYISVIPESRSSGPYTGCRNMVVLRGRKMQWNNTVDGLTLVTTYTYTFIGMKFYKLTYTDFTFSRRELCVHGGLQAQNRRDTIL